MIHNPAHRASLIAALLVGLAGAMLVFPPTSPAARVACNPSRAYVPNAPPKCEQRRYARETLYLRYNDYVARAEDFRRNAANKPYPYNQYDWSTDGCSPRIFQNHAWIQSVAQAVFNRACQQHDFGYRNFGKGLTLKRTEAARKTIDVRFLTEMRAMCRDPRVFLAFTVPPSSYNPITNFWTGNAYKNCRRVAYYVFYATVRNFSDWSE